MKLWKNICLCAVIAVVLLTETACTVKINGFVRDDRTPIDYLPVCAVELEVGKQETRTAQEWADLGINGIIRESGYENFRGEWKTQYYAVARLENGYYFFMDRFRKNGDIFDPSESDQWNMPNYTLAIWDQDENILYFLEVDT